MSTTRFSVATTHAASSRHHTSGVVTSVAPPHHAPLRLPDDAVRFATYHRSRSRATARHARAFSSPAGNLSPPRSPPKPTWLPSPVDTLIPPLATQVLATDRPAPPNDNHKKQEHT
jgi:hypothetical protein